jgi:hypothetical protein
MRCREHRLYSFIGERLRFLGLKVEEWGLVLLGILGVIIAETVAVQASLFIFSAVALTAYRRIQKVWSGSSIASIVFWKLGVRTTQPVFWPCTSLRLWIG